MSRVLSVCRVHALCSDPGMVGVTAIDKRPVAGPVLVRPIGLYGDVQADREHHGGIDKAVYAYADESADAWAAELGRPLPAGTLGENLRTSGVDVDGAVIGERWRVGEQVVLQVTAPRIPCAVFGRFLEQGSWVRRFTERGLPGAYLRVEQRGVVHAGDVVEVLDRPRHGVTVSAWSVRHDPDDARALLAAAAAQEITLGAALRPQVERAAARD